MGDKRGGAARMLLSRTVELRAPFALDLAADAPSWLVLALLGACAVALWVIVARLAEIERRLEKLSRPSEPAGAAPGQGQAGGVDLRRTEQLLQELRDGSRRLEDALLRNLAHARPPGSALTTADASSDLAERVMNRLHAMGYERIVVVTPREQFAAILAQGGDVLVEARRDGAPCKGKATFRGGALVDVTLQSAYAVFP